MDNNRNIPKSKFQGDLKLGGIYWKDAVRVRQNEGLNQWQKNHFRLMKMVEYQESVVQGYLERLLTRIGIEYSRKEYVPTNDEILDKLMSIDPEVQKLVLLNGKAAAMEMFVKQNYDLKGRYRNIFQGGRIPRNMSMKVINDYLDEVDAPTMEQSALEDYTSQMRSELAEITQRHIAKSVAQMTAWNWSRGRGIEELTRRFQEEQEKEDIDMSKVLPNAETVIRTESMKIMNSEAWRSATEVGSYADGLLWGFSYHAVGDSRTRETHLAQHGVCAPVDDPFWNEWTPPNGYNCRCWLISEWEEPSSYKQPRRDLHPDPGFAFNPANNVAGRVPQPKKQEPKKPEVNTQPQEPVVKPDELGKDEAASEKNFEKKEKNIQKPVTSPKKKRYNNMGVSKSTVKPNSPRSPEPPISDVQEGKIIPTSKDDKFDAVHSTMVKTTRSMKEAEKTIRDAGGTVQEEKPEIKPDNNPENRKEQENNDSKHEITEQEVQNALLEFHDKSSVNTETALVVSLQPDGSLLVKNGEEVVAQISETKSSESVISSVNCIFHAVIKGTIKFFSSLWLFFQYISQQHNNADIVFKDIFPDSKTTDLIIQKHIERIMSDMLKDYLPISENETKNIIAIAIKSSDSEQIEKLYKLLNKYTGGGSSLIKEEDRKNDPQNVNEEEIKESPQNDKEEEIQEDDDIEQNDDENENLGNLLDEYIEKIAKFTPKDRTFYRGLTFPDLSMRSSIIEEFLNNGYYRTDSVTSWSVLPGVAMEKALWNSQRSFGLLIELKASTRMGVIGRMSSNPQEIECVLRRYTKLCLISIDSKFNEHTNNCKIIVEEIE